jgi:hypothetical protein
MRQGQSKDCRKMERSGKIEHLIAGLMWQGLTPVKGGLSRHGNSCYDPAPYGTPRLSLAVDCGAVAMFCGVGPGRLGATNGAKRNGIDVATCANTAIARPVAI